MPNTNTPGQVPEQTVSEKIINTKESAMETAEDVIKGTTDAVHHAAKGVLEKMKVKKRAEGVVNLAASVPALSLNPKRGVEKAAKSVQKVVTGDETNPESTREIIKDTYKGAAEIGKGVIQVPFAKPAKVARTISSGVTKYWSGSKAA